MNGTLSFVCRVSFVMPSKYSMETLPVPKDTELDIHEVPQHRVAVHTSFGAAFAHDNELFLGGAWLLTCCAVRPRALERNLQYMHMRHATGLPCCYRCDNSRVVLQYADGRMCAILCGG